MNKNNFLTIMTPTYNRAHTLPKLYESLCNQTNLEFYWLVVDDGSTDNTKELINLWIKENKIKIKYKYQKNQGMNVAINSAIKIAKTELFVWIGSDDFLPVDMVETIINLWISNDINDNIAGIIGLDTTYEGKVIGNEFPNNLIECDYNTLYKKYEVYGDKTYVYRTDILKENLFPIFGEEKEMVTAYLHSRIAEKYKLLILNKSLCNVFYSQDGISNNYWMTIKTNCNGHAFYHNYKMSIENNKKFLYKHAANYVLCSIFAKKYNFISKATRKIPTILAIPAAFGLYLYRYIICNGKNPQMNN